MGSRTPRARPAELHPVIAAVASDYLAYADACAPGLVEGLYLTGSVAMGDFRLGGPLARRGPSGGSSSDIDFVAVTSEALAPADVAALVSAHDQLRRRHRRPFFDGTYVTRADLRQDPRELRGRRQVHEGRLTALGDDPLSPVLWHELAGHAMAVRGPNPSGLHVWTDGAALVSWSRTNLQDYWLRWLQRSRHLPDRGALAALTSFGPPWAVLGVSRIHHTIRTGELISKTGAGHRARTAFGPRWHRIIDESLRIRTASSRRPSYASLNARRRDTLDFVTMVLDRHGVRSEP